MPLPKPPTSLDDSCSVIYDNTLYSFSPDGFASLPLEQGAKWKKLKMGEKVTGASCVGTDAALFVVGGLSDDVDFTGLQQYNYSSGEWATITPTDLVSKDRQWHSTTYIKANDAIVIYAGSQDGVYGPSTETFSIQASAPYTVGTHNPTTPPPPALLPIFTAWSDADAVMVGGDATNTKVFLFNPIAGWRDFGASLAQPITKDTSLVQGVLLTGDDGSKSLVTFDMSQSPNTASRMVLQDASGAPVTNSAPVSSKSGTRDLTLKDWPKYNSKDAPTTTRKNFAMAQGSDGTVVFSGGNSDDPIAMFDATKNSWLNATEQLSEKKFNAEATSISSSTKSTHTHTHAHTSTTSTAISSTTISSTTETTAASTSDAAAAAAGGKGDTDSGMDSNTILGITLGTILGFLAVLGLIVFLLRRRKRQQNHTEIGHARRASGLPTDEKNPGAFTNDAYPPRSPSHFRGHHPTLSQESYSSMAILMGRMGQQKANLSRKPSNDTSRSSVSSLHKQFKSTISKPIPQEIQHQHPALRPQDDRGVAFTPAAAAPRPRPPRNGGMDAPPDGTRRSSGWNRYWSGGSALQILGFGGSKRTTVGSEQSSHYSDGNAHNPSRITQDSATVPPLNFEGRPGVSSVVSGSPVVAQHHSKVPITEGMRGKIERPVSKASSGYSSGIPESVNDAWDPADSNKPWGADRAPSSAYAPSFTQGPPMPQSTSGGRKAPSTLSQQPQLAMAATSSDMSWLNLGDQSRGDHSRV